MSISPEPIDSTTPMSAAELSAAKIRVPGYVVHRDFAHETVMLNLRTGKYHGLNPSAGAILDALDKAPTVATAIDEIAARFGKAPAEIEDDIHEFCVDLLRRNLIEVDVAT